MVTRDKEQLVKALVIEQAKVVAGAQAVEAWEGRGRGLEEEVARLRLRNETLELQLQAQKAKVGEIPTENGDKSMTEGEGEEQGQGQGQGQGGENGQVVGKDVLLVEDGTLSFLQAKTTLIVQQESSIARLSSELEAARKQAQDRVQAVSMATLEGVRLAESTAAKLELQVCSEVT